eukprot:Gb_06231 [translate_table: standard]
MIHCSHSALLIEDSVLLVKNSARSITVLSIQLIISMENSATTASGVNYPKYDLGDELSPQIESAIRTASIHIAIFSSNYAQSRWCLDELLLMLQCGSRIIPVFYDVKPFELKWMDKDGAYARAFRIHEQKQRYGFQTLEMWKQALKTVSFRIGCELDACNGDEGLLLEKIVRSVLKWVKKVPLDVAKYPVGLDEMVQHFENSMLKQSSEPVKVVGIVGCGGAGKSTLAKQLYNCKRGEYDGSCFLFDVREAATKNSLDALQSKLVKDLKHVDIPIYSPSEGKEILRSHLFSCHALIVLDYVDHEDHLDALLVTAVLRSGSLVLVTSRDKGLLRRSGISFLYEIKGLNEEHAQELFCWHAFLQRRPLKGFEELVKEFLIACHGLPLSLKVLGALLCENNDKCDKEMFLDIACFFIGENRSLATRIWDGSGWRGCYGLQALEQKCLIEIDDNNRLQMHDHLRDLGRHIVDEECSGFPLHCSRLWRPNDISNLLKQRTGTVEVRGIRMATPRHTRNSLSPEPQSFPWHAYLIELFGNCAEYCSHWSVFNGSSLRIRGLQLLVVEVEDDCLKGMLNNVGGNLVWLRWYNCPYKSIPSWLSMEKLRVLELIDGHFETFWCNSSQILPNSFGNLIALEDLTFSGCKALIISTDILRNISTLEYLNFEDCQNLQVLPPQLAYQRCLKELNLCGTLLKELPDEIGELTNLEVLKVGSPLLTTLPSSLGKLCGLIHLGLHRCTGLKCLPNSVGSLKDLAELVILSSGVEYLPQGVAEMRNLEYLNVSICPLRKEPFTDLEESMFRLQNLDLSLTKLSKVSIPSNVCPILKTLDLKYCRDLVEVEALPTTLSSLALNGCSALKRIAGLRGLGKLRRLDISNCKMLEELPSLEDMVSLEELRAFWCYKLKTIQGLQQLVKLLKVDVRECRELEELRGF